MFFMPNCMSVMVFSIVDILVWMVEALEALSVSIVTV